MFLISGHRPGPIGTKIGTRIHLDSESVLMKAITEANVVGMGMEGGVVGAERNRGGDAYSITVSVRYRTESVRKHDLKATMTNGKD